MNDLVNRIAEGRANLLGIDDICQRLGISRSTFDRWQRETAQVGHIAGKVGLGDAIAQSRLGRIGTGAGAAALAGAMGIGVQEETLRTPFPPPDIRIGASPKWEMETFKKWLTENVRKA